MLDKIFGRHRPAPLLLQPEPSQAAPEPPPVWQKAGQSEENDMNIQHPDLANYLENGFGSVDGWCHEWMFEVLQLLDSASVNKSGGCCEIGVHHGRFYMALNAVVERRFSSYAVDVFEAQHLNIDKSGAGSLAAFKDSLSRYDRHKGENTTIVCGDSTDPGLDLPGRIGFGSLRFVSIDGGHTVEHTLNDLEIAQKIVANEGVVFVDDILSHHWLGVIEGVVNYLARRPTLVPFSMTQNKMFFCKWSFVDYYRQLFESHKFFTKSVAFCGHKIAAW